MFELRNTFEKWIVRSSKDRAILQLLIKCDHTIADKPTQSFALYREDIDAQSVWVGFDVETEDFMSIFNWQYSQIS